jgi:hypothetical protein
MTSLHLWAAVAASLDDSSPRGPLLDSTPAIPLEEEPTWMASTDEAPEWLWTPPDLSSGGEWHQARVANLNVAVHGLPDTTEQLAQGLAALDVHRLNYMEAGSIHQLQLRLLG